MADEQARINIQILPDESFLLLVKDYVERTENLLSEATGSVKPLSEGKMPLIYSYCIQRLHELQLAKENTPRKLPHPKRPTSVLQDWVNTLSLMQQTVLLTAVRGADGMPKYYAGKYIQRYLRRCIMLSAFDRCVLSDPYDKRGGNFTGPIPDATSLPELARAYLKSVDELPHHFHLHLLHAAEILGYKHPDRTARKFWCDFYEQGVKDMHMQPETEGQMDYRLGDNQQQWQAAGSEELDEGRVVS